MMQSEFGLNVQPSSMDSSEKLSPAGDDPRFRITPFQQMAAACTGGVLTSFLMTPLDVVKVRLQAQQKSSSVVPKCFLYCNGLMDHICPCLSPSETGSSPTYWYSRPGQFSGTFDAFLKISRSEGFTSLWSGLSPTLVLALPATVIYFVTYEQLRSRLKILSDRRHLLKANKTDNCVSHHAIPQPAWVPLAAGCTARTWSVTIVSPLELIRTKMQSERLNYFQMNEAIRSLVRYHGITGLWKGVVPTLMRDVPFSGIYWVTYEKLKSFSSDGNISFFYSFLGGSVSGAIASLLTNPFDVVKTLYQIDLVNKQILTEPPGKSQTIIQTLKNIYMTNGISGWYSGLVPRLVKVVPACAIMVSTFETGKSYFQKKNLDHYLASTNGNVEFRVTN